MNTRRASRGQISPKASARTTMVADCVPALPQVPVTRGMKNARATIWCRIAEFISMTVVESREVNSRMASQQNRFQNNRGKGRLKYCSSKGTTAEMRWKMTPLSKPLGL